MRISWAMGFRLAQRCLWRWTTPLGSPVVPEVNTISTTSEGAGEGGSIEAGSTLRKREISRCSPWGKSSRPSWIRSAGETSLEMRPARSEELSGSMGTTAAPASREAQKAMIHSGEFSAQRRTRSSLLTPLDSSNRAAPPILPRSWEYLSTRVRRPELYRMASRSPSSRMIGSKSRRVVSWSATL